MPLLAGHAVVAVDVEVVEAVAAVVVEVAAEELGPGEHVVPVAIGAKEAVDIVLPLGAGDAPVAVAVERGERVADQSFIESTLWKSSSSPACAWRTASRSSVPESTPSRFQSWTRNDWALPRHSSREIAPSPLASISAKR